jgi:protease I
VKNKKATAHHAIKTDMINAGANYQSEGVVKDNNLITAQGAEDVSDFVNLIIAHLKQETNRICGPCGKSHFLMP